MLVLSKAFDFSLEVLGEVKPRVRPKVYPTSRWRAAHRERRRLNAAILQPPLSLAPSCPLRSPPIICPDGRVHGPNEPFGTERKEGANCSCDVGVVPFSAFSMATGHRPCKHAAPLRFFPPLPSPQTPIFLPERSSWKFVSTITIAKIKILKNSHYTIWMSPKVLDAIL